MPFIRTSVLVSSLPAAVFDISGFVLNIGVAADGRHFRWMNNLIKPVSNNATRAPLVSVACIVFIATKITDVKSSSTPHLFQKWYLYNYHVYDMNHCSQSGWAFHACVIQALRQNQTNDCRWLH